VPLLLRKIRKARWYGQTWLPAGEAPADALDDVKTTDNTLSLWLVADNLSDRDRVVAALAARCDTPSNLDYCLFPFSVLTDVAITNRQSNGETPDPGLNASAHLELIELSAPKIASLAGKMRDARRGRIPMREIKALILAGLSSGQLDSSRLEPKMLAALNQPRST